MAFSGGGVSGEKKQKLVMVGNKLVVADGCLILGPCDKSGGGGMPMTESLVIVFNGKMYQTFAQYLKLGGYLKETVHQHNSDAAEWSDIFQVQGFVGAQGASFQVIFGKTKRTSQNNWRDGGGTFTVAACELSYTESGDRIISKVFGWQDMTYRYFPLDGDPIDLPQIAEYDGPVAEFKMVRYRMGTMKRNPDGSIYFEEE